MAKKAKTATVEEQKFNIQKGKKYKLTLSLIGLFEGYAPNSLISQRFIQNGFENVEVTGDGEIRTVVGIWPNDDTSFSDKHITDVEPA